MKAPVSSLRRKWLAHSAQLTLAVVCMAAATGTVHAQAWPSKPIRIIVNFPAGGANDQYARLIAQPLQEALGQPVVVENRAGAGGNIGGDVVAKSAPDGYTLLLTSGGLVSINPALYPKMPFDPFKDLMPVAAITRSPVNLVVNPSLPVNNTKEFIAYVKANPGKLSYSSPGNGSSPHLAAEMMKASAGIYAVHVPYRGAAPALQDLLGGQIQFMFDPGIAFNHVRSGKLKLLATGGAKRLPAYPDVPTLAEAGLKGFDADTTTGLHAAAGTPPEIVARLNTEVNRIISTPAMRERIASMGGEVSPGTPAQFTAVLKQDSDRFSALIRERSIRAD